MKLITSTSLAAAFMIIAQMLALTSICLSDGKMNTSNGRIEADEDKREWVAPLSQNGTIIGAGDYTIPEPLILPSNLKSIHMVVLRHNSNNGLINKSIEIYFHSASEKGVLNWIQNLPSKLPIADNGYQIIRPSPFNVNVKRARTIDAWHYSLWVRTHSHIIRFSWLAMDNFSTYEMKNFGTETSEKESEMDLIKLFRGERSPTKSENRLICLRVSDTLLVSK